MYCPSQAFSFTLDKISMDQLFIFNFYSQQILKIEKNLFFHQALLYSYKLCVAQKPIFFFALIFWSKLTNPKFNVFQAAKKL